MCGGIRDNRLSCSEMKPDQITDPILSLNNLEKVPKFLTSFKFYRPIFWSVKWRGEAWSRQW